MEEFARNKLDGLIIRVLVRETSYCLSHVELFLLRVYLKSTLIYLTECSAYDIFMSYCHLVVNCRNLVDRCGAPGSCKPRIFLRVYLGHYYMM